MAKQDSHLHTVISLLSVMAVVGAFMISREMFKMAKQDFEMRNRPVLSLEEWSLDFRKRISEDDANFSWGIKNYGQTPATAVSLELRIFNLKNKELYRRTIFQNKYIVPSQGLTNESEAIDERFVLPRGSRIAERYNDTALKMRITLKYSSLNRSETRYVYEISGVLDEKGWKTSSNSRDERNSKDETIYIGLPSIGDCQSTICLAFKVASENHKLPQFLFRRIAGIFNGAKFFVHRWAFALVNEEN